MTPERIEELRRAVQNYDVSRHAEDAWKPAVNECLTALEEKTAENARLRATLGQARRDVRDTRLALFNANKAQWFRDRAASLDLPDSSKLKARLLAMARQHEDDACGPALQERERRTLQAAIGACKAIATSEDVTIQAQLGALACIDALDELLLKGIK